ncbi:MAG: hypothetical protein HIU92_14900 [Proteobacteria bacterium]|nr:hypothetical protein [Pseudomonadota bacterium]
MAAPQPAGLEIPPVLRDSVARHQANLLRLLESFRAAGMDDAQIEPAVTVVIDSYRRELLDAIRSLAAARDGAGGTP